MIKLWQVDLNVMLPTHLHLCKNIVCIKANVHVAGQADGRPLISMCILGVDMSVQPYLSRTSDGGSRTAAGVSERNQKSHSNGLRLQFNFQVGIHVGICVCVYEIMSTASLRISCVDVRVSRKRRIFSRRAVWEAPSESLVARVLRQIQVVSS